jgi:DNA-binding MarR family transcriptional regulator
LDPYEFIQEQLDSVPHLEALILLWNSRPVGWTPDELSSRLYVSPDRATEVLRDLQRMEIVQEASGPPPKYSYLQRSKEQDDLMHEIDVAYRRDLVRISTMIHERASSPIREFARAFRIRKDKDRKETDC